MSRYLYKAWLRDTLEDPGEAPDQWWVCLIIDAATPAQAEDWGNRLTRDYCARRTRNRFVTSEVSLAAKNPLATLDFPALRYGEQASDQTIGW